jgi:DNA replication initiation complex subunit (GINS family)
MPIIDSIRSRVRSFDERVGAELTSAIEAATEVIDEIPLKGIIPAAMRDIEQRGLEICQQRAVEIELEINRLRGELLNTKAIIEACLAKIDVLSKHEKAMSAPVGPA